MILQIDSMDNKEYFVSLWLTNDDTTSAYG